MPSSLSASIPGEGRPRVVTVLGGQGSGKTALLDAWAATCAQRVVRLDATMSFEAMRESFARQVAVDRDPTQPPSPLLELGQAAPTVVMCDNLERLRDPWLLAAAGAALNDLPAQTVLVAAGRRLPQIGWARLELTDRLVRIGPADLAEWVDQSLGLGCDEHVRELGAGWATGLVELAGSEAPTPRVLAGPLRHALDQGLAPDLQRLLAVAAFFDSVDLELLSHAAGADASRLYSELRDAPLPQVDVRESDRVLRINGALRELLRQRLRPSRDWLIPVLRRGAFRLADRGEDEAALLMLKREGDREGMAHLTSTLGVRAAVQGVADKTTAWLTQFSAAEIVADPRLQLTQDLASAVAGDFRGTDRVLTVLLDEARAPSLPWNRPFHHLAGQTGRDDGSAAGAAAPWVALGQLHLAIEDILDDRVGRAESTLASIGPLTREYVLLEAWRCAARTLAFAVTGRDIQGIESAEATAALLDSGGLRNHTWALLHDIGVLRLAVSDPALGRISEAAGHTETKLARISGGLPGVRTLGHLSLASAHSRLNSSSLAQDHVARARELMAGRSWALLARELEAVTRRIEFEQERSVRLTAGELRVLRALAGHESVAEIAAALFVSTATVRSQVWALHTKLGSHDRASTVAQARLRGLL